MFTDLYLQTTNPKLGFYECFNIHTIGQIIWSIFFHTIIYASFFNLLHYIFLGKPLSNRINIRICISLICIMFIGFIARYYHIKEIYTGYNGDMVKTRCHIDQHYNSWIFLS